VAQPIVAHAVLATKAEKAAHAKRIRTRAEGNDGDHRIQVQPL